MKNYFFKKSLNHKLGIRLTFFMILGTFVLSYGQATNATLKGKVTDGNGEPLMGATIIVKNKSTGFNRR